MLSLSKVALRGHQKRFTARTSIVFVTFLSVAHVFNEIFNSMFKAYLPLLQERFDLSGTKVALMVAVFSFTSSVVQALFGGLSDRLSRRLIASLWRQIKRLFWNDASR